MDETAWMALAIERKQILDEIKNMVFDWLEDSERNQELYFRKVLTKIYELTSNEGEL